MGIDKAHLSSLELLRLSVFTQELSNFKSRDNLSNEETVVRDWLQSQVDSMNEIKKKQYE
jgi:hypothetical protein